MIEEDIVKRLRLSSHWGVARLAADEIERLRTERDVAIKNLENLAAEIERLCIIVADYNALQQRAAAIDDENVRLRAAVLDELAPELC